MKKTYMKLAALILSICMMAGSLPLSVLSAEFESVSGQDAFEDGAPLESVAPAPENNGGTDYPAIDPDDASDVADHAADPIVSEVWDPSSEIIELEPIVLQADALSENVPEDAVSQDAPSQDGFSQDGLSQDALSQDVPSQAELSQDALPLETLPQDTLPQDTLPQDTLSQPERDLTVPSPSFTQDAEVPADPAHTPAAVSVQTEADHVYLTVGESLRLPFTWSGFDTVRLRVIKENAASLASWDEAWAENGREIGLTLTGMSEGENNLLILVTSEESGSILCTLTLPVTVLPESSDNAQDVQGNDTATDTPAESAEDVPDAHTADAVIEADNLTADTAETPAAQDTDAFEASTAPVGAADDLVLKVAEIPDLLLGLTYTVPVWIESKNGFGPVTLNAEGGKGLVEYSWGEWKDDGTSNSLRIRPLKAGQTTVTITLIDVKTGKVLDKLTVDLTARGADPKLICDQKSVTISQDQELPDLNLQIIDTATAVRVVYECKGNTIVTGQFSEIENGKTTFTPEILDNGSAELIFSVIDIQSDRILCTTSVKVTIKKPAKEEPISASVQKIELGVGETIQIRLTTPDYADDKGFHYPGNDHLSFGFVKGARTETGTSLDITGVKAGKGTVAITLIRLLANNKESTIATLKIPYVVKKAKKGSFAMSPKVLELALGKTSDLDLDFEARPADSAMKYSFSAKGIATAAWVGKTNQKLRLTGKKAGSVTLTVTMQNKKGTKTYATQTCLISVRKRIRNVTVDDLSYTFTNSDSSFSSRYPYEIPYSAFRNMYGESALADSLVLKNVWTGNCFGMTATAMLIHNRYKGFTAADFRSGATRPLDLAVSDVTKAAGLSLRDFIEALQIVQDSDVYQDMRKKNDMKNMLKELRAGRLVHFSYFFPIGKRKDGSNRFAGHSVLAYALDESKKGQATVYFYDPNAPQDPEKTVVFKLNSSKASGYDSFTTWFDTTKVTSQNDAYFTYITEKDVSQLWNLRGKLASMENNVLAAASEALDIYDTDGKLVGQVRDSEVVTDSIGITAITDIADAAPSDYLRLYLPVGSYRIVNRDESIDFFNVSMTNIAQQATVTTAGDIVEFTVSDRDALNEVQLEMDEGDNYHVSLQSTLNGKDENIIVGGVSEGETALIRTKDGQLTTEGTGKAAIDDGSGSGNVVTLTSSCGNGGDIYPYGKIPVEKGQPMSFWIFPDAGYEIDSIKVDGEETEVTDDETDTYTFEEVTDPHKIKVTFRHLYHTMDNGTVTRTPTVSRTGKVVYYCSECGKKLKTETLPKLNPTFIVSTATVTVKVGERSKDASITGLAAGDSIVKWTCADKKIAGVSQKGVIKGKRKGTTTVTAKLKSGVKIRFKVKVK